VMVNPLNNAFTFRNAHTCLQYTAYQARGGSNFSSADDAGVSYAEADGKRVRRVRRSRNSQKMYTYVTAKVRSPANSRNYMEQSHS
jgi:hypothetical protein